MLPDDTGSENTHTQALSAFNSDGYTLGANNDGATNVNQNNKNYVGWLWDAGSSTVTNTSGSNDSQVRANPTAGFSIVTGSGNSGTYGHGLGVKPDLVIVKQRNNSVAWAVAHSALGTMKDNIMYLNGNAASVTSSNFWGSSDFDTSVFPVSSNICTSGATFVAYCFANVEGYCRIGSFENPSSSIGAFVYCGFRPAFILGRCARNISSSSGAGDWVIQDTTRNPFNNPSDNNTIAVNVANAEDNYYAATQVAVDILSNGFKIRHSNSSPLGDPGRLYIFMALAEHPFKTARAR